jgi:hypothetical protein
MTFNEARLIDAGLAVMQTVSVPPIPEDGGWWRFCGVPSYTPLAEQLARQGIVEWDALNYRWREITNGQEDA